MSLVLSIISIVIRSKVIINIVIVSIICIGQTAKPCFKIDKNRRTSPYNTWDMMYT
jgi:hypothetical protein